MGGSKKTPGFFTQKSYIDTPRAQLESTILEVGTNDLATSGRAAYTPLLYIVLFKIRTSHGELNQLWNLKFI